MLQYSPGEGNQFPQRANDKLGLLWRAAAAAILPQHSANACSSPLMLPHPQFSVPDANIHLPTSMPQATQS